MRALDGLLGLACLGLGALAVFRIETALPVPLGPPPATAPLVAGPAAAAPAPLDAYADSLLRPLFSPKRRADQSATAAPRGPLVLMGTLVDRSRRFALIRPADGGDGKVVTIGQEIGGLRVREIGVGHVLLDGNGATLELRLPDPTDPPTRPRR